FLPQQSGLGEQSIGTEVNNSISEFVTNQVSRLASQIRDDVDFNVNYQSYETTINTADPTSLVKRNELQVELTKRFLNDRLIVDVGGNFDFGGSGGETSQTSSGIAGDFAVEYKITPDGRVSGKVFSESNYDVIDERNKTKNGVALQYTREFDTLKELFKDPEKQKKRDRKKQKDQDELNIEALPAERK
ncbi:MAG: translocation/assembly module TamB, partial [Chitinophagales bacterium]|nr:translocation/assembly module TamB [Chitinophagales bacterium]